MQRRLYTRGHDFDLLQQVDNQGQQFTATEHAHVIATELGHTVFASRDQLLRHFIPAYLHRLFLLDVLAAAVRTRQFRSVWSLGAGPCVFEWLLTYALPSDVRVVASDFDPFIISKAQAYLPEVQAYQFDFYQDDPAVLQQQAQVAPDLVYFMGSAYVMDDACFIRLLRALKALGARQIIDMYAGYMGWDDMLLTLNHEWQAPLRHHAGLRRLFGKAPLTAAQRYPGKMHGYGRSRGELRRLYRASGWTIAREWRAADYRYVATLE